MASIYSTLRWQVTRAQALRRDQGRCTVSRLLGGQCSPGSLHVHHIVPIAEGGAVYDVDNTGTSCAAHHPMWEALRVQLVKRLLAAASPVRCPHQHRSREARQECEARITRHRQVAA